MPKNFLIIIFIISCFSIQCIPINDTSILREIVLVTENTVDDSVISHPYILMLYYDKRDEICRNFYYEFLKLRPLVQKIHPKLKLGVFEMAPSLNTANKLGIHKHPHVKLFIHGIENEHFSHHYKPFENHQDIFQWAKDEIFRTNPKVSSVVELHSEIKIARLSKNRNFSTIFASGTSKVIYCNLQPHEAELEKYFKPEDYNIIENLQKIKQAFSRDKLKVFIADHDLELCQNNSGNILIFGSHEKHPPISIDPKALNIREISKYIKIRVHHHVLLSKDHDFLHKLWKTQKTLLFLFINNLSKEELSVNSFESILENNYYVEKFQFAIVDFQNSHGKTLFEKFRISLDSVPLLLICSDISHKSIKFLKKLEGDELPNIQSFIEKFLKNEIHDHRYYKSRKLVVKENHPFYEHSKYIHLNTEDFNETIDDKAPIIVLFYYKNINFEKIVELYNHVFDHMIEEYDFNFRLATFDLYHNEIDNIGYYNIDRMPGVFLYVNREDFIDLTDISHSHDIQNILYVLEKQMKQKIKNHSAKTIKTIIQKKNQFEKVGFNLKKEL